MRFTLPLLLSVTATALSPVAVLAPAAATAAGKPAGSVKTVQGLLDTDLARYKALVERDVPTTDRLLADELYYSHSVGNVQDRAGHFGDLASGRAKYLKIDVKEATGRIYGDVGVIHGLADFTTGPAGPASKPRRLRYTDIYVWRDGRWQMISFSCAEVKEMGPPPAAPAAGKETEK